MSDRRKRKFLAAEEAAEVQSNSQEEAVAPPFKRVFTDTARDQCVHPQARARTDVVFFLRELNHRTNSFEDVNDHPKVKRDQEALSLGNNRNQLPAGLVLKAEFTSELRLWMVFNQVL